MASGGETVPARIQDTSDYAPKDGLPKPRPPLRALAATLGAEVYDPQAAAVEAGLDVQAGQAPAYLDPRKSFLIWRR